MGMNIVDNHALQARLEILADQVDQLDNPAAAGRLRSLGEVVGNGGAAAEAWTSTGVYQLIDLPAIVDQLNTRPLPRNPVNELIHRLVSIVELLRNAFVLVPVVVTWFGISEAVNQYNAMLSQDSSLTAIPFLYLWESGFGGRTTFTLSKLAQIDAVLLLLIIALTLIVYALPHLLNNRQEQAYEAMVFQLRQELSDTLAHAALALSFHKSHYALQPVTGLGEQFRMAAQALLDEIRREHEAITQLAAQFDGLAQFTPSLLQGAQTLQSAAQVTHQAQQQLTTTIQTLSQSTHQLKHQQQTIAGTLNTLVARLDTVVREQSQLGTVLSTSITTLGTGLDTRLCDMAQEQRSLHGSLDGHLSQLAEQQSLLRTTLDTRLAVLAATQTESIQTVSDTIHSFTQTIEPYFTTLTTEFTAIGTQLGTLMIKLDHAIEEAMTTSQTTTTIASDTAKSYAEYLKELRVLQAKQTKLFVISSQAAVSLRKSLDQVKECAVELRGIAVDFSTLAPLMRALPSALQKDLFTILQEHSTAAVQLKTSAQAIDQAGQMLSMAASSLQRIQ